MYERNASANKSFPKTEEGSELLYSSALGRKRYNTFMLLWSWLAWSVVSLTGIHGLLGYGPALPDFEVTFSPYKMYFTKILRFSSPFYGKYSVSYTRLWFHFYHGGCLMTSQFLEPLFHRWSYGGLNVCIVYLNVSTKLIILPINDIALWFQVYLESSTQVCLFWFFLLLNLIIT